MGTITRFEKARVLGARALQISLGAQVLLSESKDGEANPLNLAKSEFERALIPIRILRVLPDGERQLFGMNG